MKLQIKVLLFVIVILLATGVISGGAMLYLQRKASISQFEKMATALAHALQGSLEQGMMLGEQSHIQEAMVRISREEMVQDTTVFAAVGVVAASSDTSRIGQTINGRLIQQALQSGHSSAQTRRENGLSLLEITVPIFNKVECQTCHGPGAMVLGGIQVSLDSASLDNQIRQQTVFFGAFGALTLIIIGGSLALALRRTVLRPISELAGSAQRLSQGDYTARSPGRADDEIGMLARAFNEMAENIEQRTCELENSRHELARWNLDLEDKIRQRTMELEEANKVREQLLEKLISAQEEERRRIARELHDETSQPLAAAAINLGNIADALPARYRDSKKKLAALKEQIVQTLGGVRNLALELRPSVLDDLGLPSAINWYARDYLGKRGLDVNVEISEQRKLPPYAETMLFRIIQEALTNIVKHAEASKVNVHLTVTDTRAILQVEDNGKGFNVDKALNQEGLRQNLGIHGMFERASLLNGTFTIESEIGKGTCLRVEIPVVDGGKVRGKEN